MLNCFDCTFQVPKVGWHTDHNYLNILHRNVRIVVQHLGSPYHSNALAPSTLVQMFDDIFQDEQTRATCTYLLQHSNTHARLSVGLFGLLTAISIRAANGRIPECGLALMRWLSDNDKLIFGGTGDGVIMSIILLLSYYEFARSNIKLFKFCLFSRQCHSQTMMQHVISRLTQWPTRVIFGHGFTKAYMLENTECKFDDCLSLQLTIHAPTTLMKVGIPCSCLFTHIHGVLIYIDK
jgi:hypothetical protein